MSKAERDKRSILIDYAKRFGPRVFVETGTYKGDTVQAMLQSHCFDVIHTIDIYADRAQNAKYRYISFPQVYCWHGDSAVVLPRILANLTDPALFWLDAHHSGKQIARKKGLIEMPLVAELTAILQHDCAAEHVILIDDSRYFKEFGGKYPGYPTEQELHSLVAQSFPAHVWDNVNDIIRCHQVREEE